MGILSIGIYAKRRATLEFFIFRKAKMLFYEVVIDLPSVKLFRHSVQSLCRKCNVFFSFCCNSQFKAALYHIFLVCNCIFFSLW